MPDVRREASLIRFLENLPAGTTELMCHPGYADAGNAFSTAGRELELAALTADDVSTAVKKNNITLISFNDLPCA